MLEGIVELDPSDSMTSSSAVKTPPTVVPVTSTTSPFETDDVGPFGPR